MSIGERVRHELREIGLLTLFFLVCFGIFLILKKLFLEQYRVSIYVFHSAVIGALVVAKAVVLLENTSFGNRFQHGSLIAHAIWRSLVYTAVVFVVTLAEHLVEAYLDKGDLDTAVSELWASKDFDHFLAMNLCVALSFLLYNTFAEMDRRLGRGSIRRLLFSTQAAEGRGCAQAQRWND
jgi:multisubunit Na+/H+ antiporter MnhC subunit